MFEPIIDGLLMLFSLDALPFMFIGVIIGIVFGALPGLGGNVCLAILIPFIWKMAPHQAIALLLGAHSTVTFGGSISAILINAPGTGQNVATTFDGFPMTLKGQAGKALGISGTSSALGSVFGALVLLLLLPIIKILIMQFGPAEFFTLTLVGLVLIALLRGSSLVKGLITGGIGLMLAFIGYDPVTGVIRYSFGTLYLWDGIEFIAVIIGLFAIAEMIKLYVKGGSLARVEKGTRIEKPIEGVKLVFKNWWLSLRCAAIGSLVGVVPGVGGTVANLVAYGYAKSVSKHPEEFGKGSPEGIIAPESANDAKEGGALVPTLAFGIPGSSAMALLLGAFLIMGFVPGPEMLNNNMDIICELVWTIAVAGITASLIGLSLARYLSLITYLSGELLIPFVLTISMLGAYALNQRIGDVIVAFIAGIIGYVMSRYDYPKAPLIIGLVLGPIAERNFHIAYKLYKFGLFGRPIVLGLIAVTLILLLLPYFRKRGIGKSEGVGQ